MQLAANARPKKIAIKSPSVHHRTQLCRAISLQSKAHVDNQKKNLLSSNISFTYPYNMVNFGLLTAEIVSLVWGTTTNFNGFRVLAALLHGTLVLGVGETVLQITVINNKLTNKFHIW